MHRVYIVHNIRPNGGVALAIHRTTISIPQELRDEMDAFNEQVNWSAVAAQAFRQKLFEIKSRKKTKMTRKDVLERLRGAKELEAVSYYDEGKAVGRAWAEEYATPKMLQSLLFYTEWHQEFWTQRNFSQYSPYEYMARILQPGLERTDEFDEFWEAVLGGGWKRIKDRDFLHGFGDGAIELWKEVEDEI